MSKSLKHIAFAVLLFLVLTTPAGCWSSRELNTLSIVAGAALDRTNDPGVFRLTAQLISPANIGTPGQGGGGNDKNVFVNVTETGRETFEIVRKMARRVSRRLYWSHNQALIIGQGIAKDGVRKYLDFFYRDNESRLNMMVFVARKEAHKVLSPSINLDPIPAYGLYRLSKIQAVNSLFPTVDLRDFLQILLSTTTSAVVPIIDLEEEEGHSRLVITGTAVFKGDKMVGELGLHETRGYLWVTGQVESGIILVDCPDKKGAASLEIIRSSASITPEITDGILRFTVKVKEIGVLGAQSCPQDLTHPETWAILEEKHRDAIHQEISAALHQARALKADIFGFGDMIYRRYPAVWKEIKPEWDRIFPELEVTVEVDARLRRTGEITRTIVPE